VKAALALLLLTASSALAQAPTGTCTNKIQGLSATQITAVICDGSALPLENQTMLVQVGGSQFETNVKKVTSVFGFNVVDAAVTDAGKAQENLVLLSGAPTATLQYQSTSLPVNVLPADPLTAKNRVDYEWAVGPAKAPNTNPDTPTTDATDLDAVRLTASGNYARGGIFGMNRGKESLLQSTASLSIDTTDTDNPAFADNNRAAAAVQFTNLSAGRIWMHGNAGIETHVDKAFHSDVQNFDAVLKVSGWVPVLRSYSLFTTQGEFIAAPLSFSASYGYRDRRQQGTSGSGRVFEGTAQYNLFLFDDYQVTFNGTWTVNDMSDRGATVPRTQKLFAVTISYLANNRTGFRGVASFQDGSAGSMLRDVRQYFIGVGLAKLNLGGKGSS
jgi:hypothetical protein